MGTTLFPPPLHSYCSLARYYHIAGAAWAPDACHGKEEVVNYEQCARKCENAKTNKQSCESWEVQTQLCHMTCKSNMYYKHVPSAEWLFTLAHRDSAL